MPRSRSAIADRRRSGADLVAHGPDRDCELGTDTGESIELSRPGPCGIYHDRRLDSRPVGERDAADRALRGLDGGNGPVKEKSRVSVLRSSGQIAPGVESVVVPWFKSGN